MTIEIIAMEKEKVTYRNGKKLKSQRIDAFDMAIYQERKDGRYISEELAIKILKRVKEIERG